jgi:hypothetical protein
MVVNSKIFCAGSEIVDIWDYQVNKSVSTNDKASNFSASIKNYTGINSGSYINFNDEITIYADINATNGSPTTKLFTGILEDINFKGKEKNERIIIGGKDYTSRLLDRTVQPEVYNLTTAGSIVKDIITKYTNNITTTNINTDTQIIDRITFNQTPVYDAINQLADLAQCNFYVDDNKDLHFDKKSSAVSSGYIFNNTNILETNLKAKRDTVYNQIWVYGDRYLDGYKETFPAIGGSVFNLVYNPHNTSVTVNGSIVQPGAIDGITSYPGSAIKYMVGYDDKKIVFISGTTQGNNIPVSGTTNSVTITYDRSLPIVKVGDNEISKKMYGTKVKIIQDSNIKDPNMAEQLMMSELDKYSDPTKEINIDVKGIVGVIPGETCVVDIPIYNINNATYDVVSCDYDFNKENNQKESVLSLKLNKRLPDVTDTIKDIMLDIKKLQSQSMTTSDNLSRFQYTTGSIGMRVSGVSVYTNSITGSCLLCMWQGGDYILTGTLASGVNQKPLAGSPNGLSHTALQIVWSGAYPLSTDVQGVQESGTGGTPTVIFWLH